MGGLNNEGIEIPLSNLSLSLVFCDVSEVTLVAWEMASVVAWASSFSSQTESAWSKVDEFECERESTTGGTWYGYNDSRLFVVCEQDGCFCLSTSGLTWMGEKLQASGWSASFS
jgi:hypothetical protein